MDAVDGMMQSGHPFPMHVTHKKHARIANRKVFHNFILNYARAREMHPHRASRCVLYSRRHFNPFARRLLRRQVLHHRIRLFHAELDTPTERNARGVVPP